MRQSTPPIKPKKLIRIPHAPPSTEHIFPSDTVNGSGVDNSLHAALALNSMSSFAGTDDDCIANLSYLEDYSVIPASVECTVIKDCTAIAFAAKVPRPEPSLMMPSS